MPTSNFTLPSKKDSEFSDGTTQTSYPLLERAIQFIPNTKKAILTPTHSAVTACSKSKMKEIAWQETEKWARDIFDSLDGDYKLLSFGYGRTKCFIHKGITPFNERFCRIFTDDGLNVFIEYKKFSPA